MKVKRYLRSQTGGSAGSKSGSATGNLPSVRKRVLPLPHERGEHWHKRPLGPPAAFQDEGATVLTIDPGFDGTGWALWEGAGFFDFKPPLQCGVLRPRGDDWGEAARMLWELVHDLLYCTVKGVRWIAVEWPNYRPNAMGQAVAGKGDLGKLYFAASVPLCWGCFINIDVSCVSVNEWKGQLSKELVNKRIKDRLGDKQCAALGIGTHAWDAVGIGLYLKGYF